MNRKFWASFKDHMRMLTPVRLLWLGVALPLLLPRVWGAEALKPSATPAESLTVVPGFKVQLLHSAERSEGSWICMTIDAKGRLIISPQDDQQPLLRVTLSHAGQVKKIETIPAPVHQSMGLLYAHDSLYGVRYSSEGQNHELP